jgi:hypothetical protein
MSFNALELGRPPPDRGSLHSSLPSAFACGGSNADVTLFIEALINV